MDEWTDGPGLAQSVMRYKWLITATVLLGALSGYLWSAIQPTQYEGVVRIFVNSEVEGGDPGRTVASHAQFLESSTVSDRVVELTGDRLTRKELEKRLTVEPSARADFITIRTLDSSPENAAALADTVALAYRQILGEQTQAAVDQTIARLEQVQERLAGELAQIRDQRKADADNPALAANEQAKVRQLAATASEMEQVSAGAFGAATTTALQDKAALPDEPAEPKPLRAGAIGAIMGLLIGVALAWWLAGRRGVTSGSEDTAEFLAHVDDELTEAINTLHDLAESGPNRVRQPSNATAEVDGAESDARHSYEMVPRSCDGGLDGMAEAVRQVSNVFERNHSWLYQHDFPQIVVEQLSESLHLDHVAVWLRTDNGLDLAGRVGPPPHDESPANQYGPILLDKLGSNEARLISTEDRRELLDAGITWADAETVVVAPLRHEDTAFGVLLARRQEQDQQDDERPPPGTVDSIGWVASNVAPHLHAWLLLERIREQLKSPDNAAGQAKSRGNAEALSEPGDARTSVHSDR